jgi:hypothetical protein
LTLVSFFLALAVAEWLADNIFRAGLIGQVVVGLIYGVPIGDILAIEWQETFLVLGYIGLILIIFEGLWLLPCLVTLLDMVAVLLSQAR